MLRQPIAILKNPRVLAKAGGGILVLFLSAHLVFGSSVPEPSRVLEPILFHGNEGTSASEAASEMLMLPPDRTAPSEETSDSEPDSSSESFIGKVGRTPDLRTNPKNYPQLGKRSKILGILGFVLAIFYPATIVAWTLAILAIVYGTLAIRREYPDRRKAAVGVGFGIATFFLTLVVIALVLVVFGVI